MVPVHYFSFVITNYQWQEPRCGMFCEYTVCQCPPQDTSLEVSLSCSLATSLPRSIHLPLASSLPPSIPRPVPSSLVPFINPPSPTSLRSNPLGHRAPIQLNVGLHRVCVWCWRAVLSRSYCLAPTDVWHWHNGGIHSCRRRSFNDPLLHSAYVRPPQICFLRIVKNPTTETCNKHT